jgi:hypothetical protein
MWIFKNAMILVTKYDNQLLLPLLIETYKLLMPNLVEELQQSTHNLDNCDLFHTIDYRSVEGICSKTITWIPLLSCRCK